jgi:5-methyltetrahydrofolate--homocysteine methyltransferase
MKELMFMGDFTDNFNEISGLLQKGKAKEIVVAVQDALNAGAAASDILEKGLITGMNVIGGKFKRGEVFVPEVLIAARAMNHASATLKPALAQAGIQPVGQAIICTVKGDLHDIGKNLVKMMIEGKGIDVVDLGVDCSNDKILNAVQNSNAKVLCLSALLTTTMMAQKDVIDTLKTAGLRDKVKIMVGGAPVTQNFADEIGADAYTSDAASAAEVCRTFYN